MSDNNNFIEIYATIRDGIDAKTTIRSSKRGYRSRDVDVDAYTPRCSLMSNSIHYILCHSGDTNAILNDGRSDIIQGQQSFPSSVE